MGVFEMVVAIVAISITGGVISKSIKAKVEAGKSGNKKDQKISAKRFNEIEQRLIVLEQIVTSEGYDLKQQFKNIENE
ncbi:MAG: hypothetical protein HOM14_07315 [Gammaproteobacteria bacterium]|jgi:hypothetical protein|nr:hypothetical protein [Gammaproteobacteria bacterium]MBT3725042.1 hypothetical protein [Gammaproteobacteria bacterium]MBT4078699.1 hypothetical protein [Gammaproteobacteria bacterium]MBT4195906.1 hypothetical protein [Gammaproteobacteria bacterium]MBT4451487.1 hypothetical protein [Gammaproteobacteria bacterium]